MKKLIAATLLTIHLFNIGGQLALHQYFTYLSDKFFNEQISMGRYNVNDLTEVIIPSNMPGITDWKNYENVQGQIQFENASYNYVKMKITRYAIYLMCVPNYETTHLSGQNMICAKHVKDIPVPKKEHVPYGKITLLDKISLASVQIKFIVPVKKAVIKVIQPDPQLINHPLEIPEQPPKFAC